MTQAYGGHEPEPGRILEAWGAMQAQNMTSLREGPGWRPGDRRRPLLDMNWEPLHHLDWACSCCPGAWGSPGTWGSSRPVGTFHWSTCSFRAFTSSMSPGTLSRRRGSGRKSLASQ